MKVIIFLALLLTLVLSEDFSCKRLNFLPMPTSLECGKDNLPLDDPCKLIFHIKTEDNKNEHLS